MEIYRQVRQAKEDIGKLSLRRQREVPIYYKKKKNG